MKRILILILGFMVLFFINCQDDDYEVDYDDDNIVISYKDNTIFFENNLDTPVIIDNMRINDEETLSYIKYRSTDYIKTREDVIITDKDKLNQIILISSIVLPKEKKAISYKLTKEDYVVFEFYPVTYMFLADNVYFLDKKISDSETKYKLCSDKDIKNLKLSYLNTRKTNELNGIMLYVKEYQLLEDTFEEKDFELDD